jgi:hypothetical protein
VKVYRLRKEFLRNSNDQQIHNTVDDDLGETLGRSQRLDAGITLYQQQRSYHFGQKTVDHLPDVGPSQLHLACF